MAHSVFISHSSKNKQVADRFCAALEKAGQKCWIAPRDIRSGESWPAAIASAVSASEVLVLVFSEYANDSKDVANEVVLAMEAGIPVLPIKIDNAEPKGVLQYYLTGAHWQVVNNPPIEYQLLRLAKAVEKTILNLPERREAAELKRLSEQAEPKSTWQTWKQQRHPLIWFAILIILAFLVGSWLYNSYSFENGIVFDQGQHEDFFYDDVGRHLLNSDQENKDRGNLGGNLINGGFVVHYGDHVYYLQKRWGRVLRANLDGYNRENVTGVDAYSLNIVDNWLYYLNYSEEGKIYKLNLNNISGEGDIGNKVLEDHTGLIMLVGSWIYYVNYSHENRVYRVRTDGSERTRLTTDPAAQLYVAENHVYFTNMHDHNRIYQVGLDGRGLYALHSDSARNMQVADGWVYYINEGEGNMIYKIKPDGQDNQLVVGKEISQFIVYKDWLYYLVLEGNVYQYNLVNKSDEERSEMRSASFINICEPWLYYIERVNEQVYRTRLQGNGIVEHVN